MARETVTGTIFPVGGHKKVATGEPGERRLEHREAAEKFYREFAAQGAKVRVVMEASGHPRWFERLLARVAVRVVEGKYRASGGANIRRIGAMRSIFWACRSHFFSQD